VASLWFEALKALPFGLQITIFDANFDDFAKICPSTPSWLAMAGLKQKKYPKRILGCSRKP
jgi:hypothetical protein